MCRLPDIKQSDILPSCFNSHTVNNCSFCVLLSAIFFRVRFLLVILLLFKMAHKHNAEVLPRVRKSKKVLMRLTGENSYIRKDMNHSAIAYVRRL